MSDAVNISLKMIYSLIGLPVCRMAADDDEMIFQGADQKNDCPYAKDPVYSRNLREIAKVKGHPVLLLEEEVIFCGLYLDPEENLYIIGPLVDRRIGDHLISRYRHRHHVKGELAVQQTTYGLLRRQLALLAELTGGHVERYEEIDIVSCYEEDCPDRENITAALEKDSLQLNEDDRGHDARAYEQRIWNVVKNGDRKEIRHMVEVNAYDPNEVGIVADDQNRQTEYMIVSLITIVTRAAIEGGMNPEKAYQMADIYMRRLAEFQTNADRNRFGMQVLTDFTDMVAEAKENSKCLLVEECRDYIAKHLRKPFQVSDISEELHVSREYLSRLFRQTTGMTIREYVIRERCEHAANMLRYSECEISTIAEYFCFSSQSRFGMHFKAIYGVTPGEYRQKNKYIYTSRK